MLIDGLMQGLRSLPEVSDALTKLSVKIFNLEVALKQITRDLNLLQTMEQITRALLNQI